MNLRALVDVLRFREANGEPLSRLGPGEWQCLIKVADRAQLTFPLADKYGASIKVVKVDVDANQAVAGRYGIRGIPTIGLFEAGKLTKQAVGARPRHAIESELGLTRFAIAAKK